MDKSTETDDEFIEAFYGTIRRMPRYNTTDTNNVDTTELDPCLAAKIRLEGKGRCRSSTIYVLIASLIILLISIFILIFLLVTWIPKEYQRLEFPSRPLPVHDRILAPIKVHRDPDELLPDVVPTEPDKLLEHFNGKIFWNQNPETRRAPSNSDNGKKEEVMGIGEAKEKYGLGATESGSTLESSTGRDSTISFTVSPDAFLPSSNDVKATDNVEAIDLIFTSASSEKPSVAVVQQLNPVLVFETVKPFEQATKELEVATKPAFTTSSSKVPTITTTTSTITEASNKPSETQTLGPSITEATELATITTKATVTAQSNGTDKKSTAIIDQTVSTTSMTERLEEESTIIRLEPYVNKSRGYQPVESDGVQTCSQYLKSGQTKSGIYKLKLPEVGEFYGLCEMDENDAWLVIQQRQNGDEVFYNRSFNDYALGFGDQASDHWLGLEKIRALLNRYKLQLRIEARGDRCDKRKDDLYLLGLYDFTIATRKDGYRLTVSNILEGNFTDPYSDLSNCNGAKFATVDRQSNTVNCADLRKLGAWWHPPSCSFITLNGAYNNDKCHSWSGAQIYARERSVHASVHYKQSHQKPRFTRLSVKIVE
ncbi:unnamed protein product [Bursaphelenchus okinawaensis]|uniref:Fibrinogen C-terminal domain-containing protein n=1 Tax=Bursaphelenchus okinawaensis TaxID=465554 RepID=A0A811LPA9_9BILA|nr:unnamed protein product [Bursaphelenchus okinawaensis]CAG9125474.1 unnamed protein product [Bursaphelenchus okinawaensis]